MSEPKQIVPEKISILGIRILGGNINSEVEVQPQKIKSFNVQFGLGDGLNFEDKIFRFLFNVNIDALDENDHPLGVSGEYKIEYVFQIDNLEYYIISSDTEKKNVVFHNVLLFTLVSLVYSTSRGIVLSRTIGTVLEGVILPVIDVKDLVKSLEEERKFTIEGVKP